MTGPYQPGPGLGGTLSGAAGLLEGLNALRDPKAQERAKLLAYLQANPQALPQYQEQYGQNPSAILGRKPLFGKSNYDELSALLSQPITDPKYLAAQAKAQNDLAIEKGRGRIISAGDAFDRFERTGEGGQVLPAPNNPGDAEQGIEDISVVKGPGITPDDYQRYRELMTQGGIQTDEQRAHGKALVAATEASTKQQLAQSAEEEARTNKLNADAEQAKASSAAAANIMKRLPKGTNLFEAKTAGKISPVEHLVASDDPAYKEIYERDMQAHFQQLGDQRAKDLNAANKQAQIDARNQALASHIYEMSAKVGMPLGMDDISQMIDDPRAILDSTDPKTQYIRDTFKAIGAGNAKQNKASAFSAFAKSPGVNDILKRAGNGEDISQGDLNFLNMEAATAYKGNYVPAPVFSVNATPNKDIVHSLTGGLVGPEKHTQLRVAGDPDIASDVSTATGIPLAGTEQKKEAIDPKIQAMADAAIKSGATEEQIIAEGKKNNAPPEILDAIVAAYRAKKGTKK